MNSVYVRLTERELEKIHEALSKYAEPDAENLMMKIRLLVSEMQPGTTLMLEAVKKEKGCKAQNVFSV